MTDFAALGSWIALNGTSYADCIAQMFAAAGQPPRFTS